MTFQFQWLCELFDDLQRNLYRRTLSTARVQNHEHQLIYNWYRKHSHRIARTGPSAVAFLSCLLPERRPDRVYNLKAKRLSQIFGRALCLGTGRAAELNGWQKQDGADFATCVERILKQCENNVPAPGREVTLEEINEVLDLVAAHALSSSPAIKAKLINATPTELLGPILRRLKSNEAKWFIRMLLKNYAPIQVPEYHALHGFHFMLPNLLTLQNSFDAAIAVLGKQAIRRLPARPEKNYEVALHALVAEHVQPRLGVMIKRQPYHKARSIKNCCSLANGRQMSIERKYDGEYCQIHVDLSKGHDCLQIFSKSGRDSTSDRARLHSAVKDALRIGRNGCRIRKKCIVEGELLVWNVSTKQIQPFYKIRRHVKHGGREIGTAQDSPSRPEEHLMIAFYDILVLDDRMLLNEHHRIRRQHLKAVLQTVEGRAILCEREVIDFRAKRASAKLREMFARSITQRWEGLVLKGLQEPYFAWNGQKHGIKLKKDYIAGLGDSADLCIVGGRRDPQAELEIGLGQLTWTTFYVGAVRNLDAVRRFGVKPRIMIIDTLTHHSMPNGELLDLNQLGRFSQTEYALEVDQFVIEMDRLDLAEPTVLFKEPFIVEIMGAGFEKLGNSSLFTLRFPRKIDGKVKLHTDRTLLDTVSLSELQLMAEQSLQAPEDHDSQEDARWIERLIEADGKTHSTQSISQNSSCVRTVASASAVSLSPVIPGLKTSSRIYVRPDTEEPESQSQSKSTDTTVSKASIPMAQIPTSATYHIEEDVQPHPCSRKRPYEPLTVMHNNELREKKQRLSDRTHNENQADSTISRTDNDLDMSPPDQRMKNLHGSTGHLKDAVEQPVDMPADKNTVGTFTEFSSSQRIISLADALEGSPNESPTTPDSTLLMRQILSMSHYHDDEPIDYSPTKILFCKDSSRRTPTTEQNFNQPQHTTASILPTPPTSSPAVHGVTGRQTTNTSVVDLIGTKPQRNILQTSMSDKARFPTTHSKTEPNTAHPQSTLPIRKIQQPSSPHPQSNIQTTTAGISPILILTPTTPQSTILSKINSDFNFSPQRFLTQLDTSLSTSKSTSASPPHHIIIIDSLLPERAADAFEALAHTMQSHLNNLNQDVSPALTRYNTEAKILVFDHRVLEHTLVIDDDDDGKLDVDVLRSLDFNRGHGRDAELFCGVLVFFEMESEKNGKDGNTVTRESGLKVGIDLEYKFDWLERS